MTPTDQTMSAGEAPHECLRDASFCIAVTGEGAYAEIVHGGWQAMLDGLARTLWTDGDTSHNPEEWAEWVEQLTDRDEWLHDESNEPSSFHVKLEISDIAIYRLDRAALPAAAPAAVPEGWGAAIKSVRDGLGAGSRSPSNTDFEVEYGGALLDAVAERLELLAAAPPAPAAQPVEPSDDARDAALELAYALSDENRWLGADVSHYVFSTDSLLRFVAALSASKEKPRG